MISLIDSILKQDKYGNLSILNITTFLLSLSYSLSIMLLNKLADNAPTILFTLYLLILLIIFFKEKNLKKIELSGILLLMCSIHLGILLGFSLSGAEYTELWVTDSLSMHAPSAINISNFLNGTESLRTTYNAFDKTYITNIVTGFYFYFLGISPSISGIALLTMKFVGVYALYKLGEEAFNENIAKLASIIYILVPTIIFYGITYYKESTVQAFTTLFFLGLYKQKDSFSLKYFSIVIVSLTILLIERFYLFPVLGGTCLLFIFFSKKMPKLAKVGISLVAVTTCMFFYNVYSSEFPLSKVIEVLKQYKINYNNYPDVNKKYNLELFYPLAFIKLSLTPFFTTNKFNMFSNYSYLLIWGSFTNQAIVITAGYSLLKTIKVSIRNHWPLLLPTFFIFALFAYISPYNGRIRDTFYPIICLWASRYIFTRLNNAS